MIVNRTLFINPVEPEYMAFRITSGIDTKIDFSFKGQNGAPWTEDLLAQLQMTSRSDDRTQYYSCPATDVVNGRARAVIPGGLNYDPNGWRLRLTGTVDQEPRVLAYGVATALAGAGPQVEAQDVIDSIDLHFYYANPVLFTVKVWQDEGKYVPYDLTTVSVGASVYDRQGGTLLVPFTVGAVTINTVELSLTAAQVDILPNVCWWSLTIAAVPGLTTIAEGKVTISALT